MRKIKTKANKSYSKATNFLEMAIMLACAGLGVYILLTSESFVLGLILTAVGGYFAFKEFKQATNRNPQIVIDSNGIKTINVGFKGWEEIKKEAVIREGYGKNTISFLKYVFKSGQEKIRIDEFDITPKALENILKTYRIRHSKHH